MPLSIRIDANTASIAKSIDELNADLKAFKSQLEKATDTATISRLNKAIKETEQNLKGIKNLGFDSNEIRNGANTASFALTNLSRVAQDAPFGFIAIQNNLDPLLGSFRQLVTETGSVGGAVKALGSSLMGGAGLGLAFNLVVSAITFFTMNTKKAADAVADADKKFKDFAETIKTVAAVSDEAIGSNTGQIAVVRALGAIVQDTNKSYAERKRALEELKQTNKNYFGDLKLEADQMPKLTAAINEYAQAIIAAARVRGLSDEISRLTVEQLKQDRILQNLKTRYDQAKAAVDGYKGSHDLMVDGEAVAATDWLVTQKNLKDAESAYISQRTKVEQLGVSVALLNGDVAAAVNNQEQFKDATGESTKKVDELAKRISALKDLQSTTGLDLNQKIELTQLQAQITNRDAIKLGLKPEEVKERIQFLIDEVFPKEFTNFRVNGELFVDLKEAKIQNPEILTKDMVKDIQGATGSFNIEPQTVTVSPPKKIVFDPFAEAMGNAFAESLSTIADKIGEAFTTGDFAGGLKEAAGAILGILGETLQNIGKQLIATSVLVKALKAALNGIFGPGGDAIALAVGIGLVAFGGVLKNIPKMADGGIATGSMLANIGEAGSEVVMPLTKLPYLMNQSGQTGNTVVGLRVKGRELIAMLEREKSFAKRLG